MLGRSQDLTGSEVGGMVAAVVGIYPERMQCGSADSQEGFVEECFRIPERQQHVHRIWLTAYHSAPRNLLQTVGQHARLQERPVEQVGSVALVTTRMAIVMASTAGAEHRIVLIVGCVRRERMRLIDG